MRTIPLLVPHMPDADSILPYLRMIDTNRQYTNYGPLNDAVEKKLVAAVPGEKFSATTVSNCTVGLELALQASGIGVGARVLIPSITFVATATAVIRAGALPVFADVDAHSWTLTPDIALAAANDKDIDAVMPVSTFGASQDAAAWDAFTRKTGIPVIIDAAGAFGNQSVGSTTDVVFSFHATKSFGAGEGGAVLSANRSKILKIRQLANFGIDTSTGLLSDIGTNGKMSEYHCAVALASFDMWKKTVSKRVELSTRYTERLRESCPTLVFQRKSSDGVYPLLPVLIPPGLSIADVSHQLQEKGIATRRWYSPALYKHPALDRYESAGKNRVSDDVGDRILGLPFYLGISPQDIDYIAAAIAAAV